MAFLILLIYFTRQLSLVIEVDALHRAPLTTSDRLINGNADQ
jgi:hypothetical protein